MEEIFWIYDPSILIKKENLIKIVPDSKMNSNEKLNAISRLVILCTILAVLITEKISVFITGLITLLSIVFLYMIKRKKEVSDGIIDIKESFTNNNVYNKNKGEFTNSNSKNPLMNVLLNEYTDNAQDRKKAGPSYFKETNDIINENTKQMIRNNFNDNSIGEKLFDDFGDKFNFNQSMRNWYVMPNTQIPNAQDEFANFCYGNMKSCRDGDDFACIQNEGRWRNPF